MNLQDLFTNLQYSPVGEWVNSAGPTFPIIESLHVLAISLVFGTILIVDLRLLGLASTNRQFTAVAHDLLRLTWCGFVLAVITGTLLFLPNASTLWLNFEFQTKMVLLTLAGINMMIFELVTARSVGSWNIDARPPIAARAAGLLSIGLWISVIVFGRLIGFASSVEDPFALLL